MSEQSKSPYLLKKSHLVLLGTILSTIVSLLVGVWRVGQQQQRLLDTVESHGTQLQTVTTDLKDVKDDLKMTSKQTDEIHGFLLGSSHRPIAISGEEPTRTN